MELKSILEALLFSANKPLSPRELKEILVAVAEKAPEASAFKKAKEDLIVSTLEALAADYANLGRSFLLTCVAGSWQFVTQPDYGPWLKAYVGEKNRPTKLSQPALETLAIIAYRQPLTRGE